MKEEVSISRYKNNAAQARWHFFLVTATIVMNNMMVKERMSKDKMESDSFYEVSQMTSDTNSDDDNASENMDGSGDVNVVGNFDITYVQSFEFRFLVTVQKVQNQNIVLVLDQNSGIHNQNHLNSLI